MQIVTHPQLLEDVSLLDPVLNSASWQTLMAFTRDSARKSSLWSELELMNEMDSSSYSRMACHRFFGTQG